MAEGIETGLFGKLTYYAVAIYTLFVLGLLIVCRKRYKSRTGRDRANKETEKDVCGESTAKAMGLKQSKSNHEKKDCEAVRKRKGKVYKKQAKLEDGGTSISTTNGQILQDNAKETVDVAKKVNLEAETNKHEGQTNDTGISSSSRDGLIISESDSAWRIVTSASDDNKNTITSVIEADCRTEERRREERRREERRTDVEEMGRKAVGNRSIDENVAYAVTTSTCCKDTETNANAEDMKENINKATEDVEVGGENFDESNYDKKEVDKEVSDTVLEAFKKSDKLDSYANNSSFSIVDKVLDEIKNRRWKTAEDQIHRKEKAAVSPKLDRNTTDDLCGESKLVHSVKDQMKEFADNLATGILYGFDEDGLPLEKLPSVSRQCSLQSEKAIEKISLGFCKAIASDVCRNAPKVVKELDAISERLSESILEDAVVESSKPSIVETLKQKPVCHKSNLRAEGQRKKIFCSSENIVEGFDDAQQKDVKQFSTDVGNHILDNAIKDVKYRYGNDGEHKTKNFDKPDVRINDKELNCYEDASQRDGIDKCSQDEEDSFANSDADDEDDDGEDSCYSDGSDKEGQPPVIIRNKNKLKLKIHSDRPLSGYAEQLVQFLADDDDDDDGLDMFESDEEFDAVLDKLEEKYKNDEELYNKIQKRRKLSETRRMSGSSTDTSRGIRKRILSLDRLSDEDSRDRLTSTMSESSLLSNTDTDDALKGVFSDDQMLSPGPGKFDLKTTVAIDTGCGTLKAGLAGEIAPSILLPSVIGVPRRFSVDVSKMTRGYYIGDEAIYHAGMLQLDHPIKQDVTNWSDVCNLLEFVLEEALQVNVRDHPILLTEIGLMPKKHREKVTEIMFERFGAQAFFLANQGPLSLYSMGLTSGLCLNSGYSTTQAIPVYEGYSLPYCTRQLDIGGQQITDYLGRLLLSEKGQAFSSSSEKFLLSDMMQRNCYVPEDIGKERELLKKRYDDVGKLYELPDGQLIDLGSERFESSEILYEPELTGLEQKPLHAMVIDSISAADPDMKKTLMNNALVTGGTSLLKGFTNRLDKELTTLQDHTGQVNLKNANNPVTATWNGASVISSMSTFSQQCIITDHYAEFGSQIVHMKCF